MCVCECEYECVSVCVCEYECVCVHVYMLYVHRYYVKYTEGLNTNTEYPQASYMYHSFANKTEAQKIISELASE